jgi:hypothetical protein
MITSLFPSSESLTLDALLARCNADALAEPFADDSIAFCDALSKRMLRMPGPQWTALGFFFREAAVKKMRDELRELERGTTLANTRSEYGSLRAPRGLVFHVTPGNVDTQFLYSWLFSLLVGNANVVRVSSRLPEAAKEACRSLGELTADFPRIRASSTIVSYEHDKSITDALSRACDLRVLWGGDASIAALRESPLRADAKEMAFPDRFSFALVAAEPYLAMDDAARTSVARGLQNDIFIFDQMACSSPKVLAWLGTREHAQAARADLWPRLEKLVEAANLRVQTMTALDKLHFAHGELADGKVTSVERFSNELFVLRAGDVARLRSASWGGGLVVETVVSDIEAALGLVQHSDQTLTHAGFTKDEVVALARRARTRGLARIVPVGRALAFSRYWDGMDLLSELTRVLSIEN